MIRVTVREYTRARNPYHCERVRRHTVWLLFIPLFSWDTIEATYR